MKKKVCDFLFFTTVVLGMLIGLYGCDQEEQREVEGIQKIEAQYRVISKSDIPVGIQPIQLKDKTELYEFIDKVNKIDLKKNTSVEGVVVRVKTARENNDTSGGEAGSKSIIADLDSKGEYSIIIDLTYAKKGVGAIAIASKNSKTWNFSSWTQDTGVADWLGESSIQYAITGTIKWYIVVKLEWIEVSRQSMSVSGTEQI